MASRDDAPGDFMTPSQIRHAVLGFIVVAVGSERAFAYDNETPTKVPSLNVSMPIGLAMPLGFVGIEVTVDPLTWLSVSGGVGIANFEEPAPSQSVMVRVRPLDKVPLFVGAGPSRSQFTIVTNKLFFEPSARTMHWQGVLWWANAEAGIEVPPRASRRFLMRLFVGVGRKINPDDFRCTWGCVPGDRPPGRDVLPYLGLALGWRLL